MNFKPIPYYKGPSYLHKKRRILWLNSSFNSGFTLIDNKVYDVFFDLPPLQIYKNSKLKVLTYIRDSNQSSPIVIKLKDLNFKRNSVINTDNEYYPVIYSNHTGVEGMTFTYNPSITLIPQQIPRITLRLDDNYNNHINGLLGTITNGELFQIPLYIIFKTSGSFILNKNCIADILVVGGGGGGSARHGGGGGAGAVIYENNQSLISGTYSITVGNGGSAGLYYSQLGHAERAGNGSDSIIEIVSPNQVLYKAIGGGGATCYSDFSNRMQSGDQGGSTGGMPGGSDGFSIYPSEPISTNIINGVSGFIRGNKGGRGSAQDYWSGGGGGGASSIGSNGGRNQLFKGGDGGDGLLVSIKGFNEYYGGGGGGGTRSDGIGGNGGLGGGGNGGGLNRTFNGTATPANGYTAPSTSTMTASPNSGGGGGGGGYLSSGNYTQSGGAGGSGIVIIRFNSKRIEGITPINNKPPPFILGLELEDE